jgi:hypothetical protein
MTCIADGHSKRHDDKRSQHDCHTRGERAQQRGFDVEQVVYVLRIDCIEQRIRTAILRPRTIDLLRRFDESMGQPA